MKPNHPSLLRRATLALSLAALAGHSGAEIKTGSSEFELVLMVLDQTNAKLSYTLDLGIDANSFWIAGQQDTGASLFRTIDPATDVAFSTFIAAANPATTRWLVMGVNAATLEGNQKFYATMTNDGKVATQTANFDRFKSLDTGTLTGGAGQYATFLSSVSSAGSGAQILQSTHRPPTINGSSVASKDAGNVTTYAQKQLFQTFPAASAADGDCVFNSNLCLGNPTGTSSWFYRLTPLLLDGTEEGGVDSGPIVLDEFDNITADGFWGFVKDPASAKYILSYTLTGSSPATLVSTDAGRTRLSFTDYSAQSGSARQIAFAADDVANAVDADGFVNGTGFAVTAVPEPQTWGLMALGLAGLGAVARRRKNAAGLAA